jgi:hypothetical protein
VQHGRVIVGDEFRYSGATGKGALEVFDGGILELQSGACVAPFIGSNRKSVYNVNIYRNGTLQAGSPERPLTSDARLLLGFVENDQPGRSGLYAAVGSLVRVFTTDPTKARLVISAISSDPEFYDGNGEPVGDPAVAAHGNTGIALQLAGDTDLNGVHFDYVSAGGIGLAGGEQPGSWSNVTWGAHNAGEPESLFGELAAGGNVYYHSRSDERSEYGLTVRAVAEMVEYMETRDPFRLHTLPPNIKGQDSTKDFRPVLQVETAAGAQRYFLPRDDAFLQNGQPVNSGQLSVKPGNRITFLKFDVSGVGADARSATLKLTENGDVGNGTLRVYKGSHSNWTETSITLDNAPGKQGELDSVSGSVKVSQTVEFDVSSLITGDGVYSVIVDMDKGGNDIAFSSKENKSYNFMERPEALIFKEPIEVTIETRTPGAKIRYTLDGTEPTRTSPVYEGPIPLNKTTRLMARAYKLGVGFSPVFSTTYVFGRP